MKTAINALRERDEGNGLGMVSTRAHVLEQKMYECDLRDPYLKTWLRVRQAWEALERAMEMELERLPATLSQIDILLILRGNSVPLTPTQIASYMFRAQHSVSGLITRMERAGYVKKVRSKKDRRLVEVVMQPKGEELVSRALASGFHYARRIVEASLTEEEIKRLDVPLKKLRDGALLEMGLTTRPLPNRAASHNWWKFGTNTNAIIHIA